MRQLWRDIDDAKHKAGIGRAPEPEPMGYGREVFGWLDRAATLVGGATTWISAKAPGALAALASGAELLRAVPLVGRLVDLVPLPEAPPAPPPERASLHHTNGSSRPIVVDADDIDTRNEIEAAFSDDSKSGLGAQLSAFYSAWADLAANPESSAARTAGSSLSAARNCATCTAYSTPARCAALSACVSR